MAVACYNRTSPIECSELGQEKLPIRPISDAVILLVRLTRGRDKIYLAEKCSPQIKCINKRIIELFESGR